jgi:hypothetical protein
VPWRRPGDGAALHRSPARVVAHRMQSPFEPGDGGHVDAPPVGSHPTECDGCSPHRVGKRRDDYEAIRIRCTASPNGLCCSRAPWSRQVAIGGRRRLNVRGPRPEPRRPGATATPGRKGADEVGAALDLRVQRFQLGRPTLLVAERESPRSQQVVSRVSEHVSPGEPPAEHAGDDVEW